MAEPYLTQLDEFISGIGEPLGLGVTLEAKHFFSGAALYANQKICASFSPAGFAIKLPEDRRNLLFQNNQAAEFRFFPSGPIKREYALLSQELVANRTIMNGLLVISVRYVLSPTAGDS